MSNDAARFFSTLFARKSAAEGDGHLLIWTKGNDEQQRKISLWHTDPQALAGIAIHEGGRGDHPDVYFGCTSCDADRGASRRTTKKNARAMFFVWADIDVAGDGHKGRRYPGSFDEAVGLARSVGIPPSVVVQSGGGIHVYWVLDEPIIIGDEQTRAQCERLSEGFQAALRARAGINDWTIDSTADLARVLRVPETTNRKYDTLVTLIECSDARYSFEQISDIAGETPLETSAKTKQMARKAAVSTDAGGIINVNIDAEPPMEKLETLCEYDAKFKQTYERKRRDLESQSEYDLALASFAVIARWTDQEIAALIIYHRRKHKEDVQKALREDYIRRTIKRARSNVSFDAAQESISENLDAISEGEQTVEEAREELLRGLSETLQVEIKSIVKYDADPPLYKLRTSSGEITINNVKMILSQQDFRAFLADASGIVIRRFKPLHWDEITQAILKACIVQDLELSGTMMGRIEGYLDEHTVYRDAEREMACENRQPFAYHGKVAIFLDDFRKWLSVVLNVKIDDRKLAAELRAAGSEMGRVRFRGTTRSVCLLPLDPRRFIDGADTASFVPFEVPN